jgi:hypothetical protein
MLYMKPILLDMIMKMRLNVMVQNQETQLKYNN